MVKKLTLFALRMLFVNAVVMLVALLIMMPVSSLWPDNMLFQWVVTLSFTALFWVLVWLDAGASGKKDIQKDKITRKQAQTEGTAPIAPEALSFRKWFGYVGGLLAQSPALLLTLVLFFAPQQLAVVLGPILRAWNITYIQAILSGTAAMPYLLLVFPVLFAAVAGLGYMNAEAQQARLETIIERNKTKKARRVQDERKYRKNDKRRP